jgi:hypothetical protein
MKARSHRLDEEEAGRNMILSSLLAHLCQMSADYELCESSQCGIVRSNVKTRRGMLTNEKRASSWGASWRNSRNMSSNPGISAITHSCRLYSRVALGN